MSLKRGVGLLMIIVFLGGCAVYRPLSPGALRNSAQKFSAEWPGEGWMEDSSSDAFLISRDGFAISYILVKRDKLDRDLQVNKQRFTADMEPWELAGVQLDILQSDIRVTGFQLIANRAVVIDGHPGYCIDYQYTNHKGVGISGIRCGSARDPWIYHIVYEGLTEYYFDRGRADFEHFLRTFKGL